MSTTIVLHLQLEVRHILMTLVKLTFQALTQNKEQSRLIIRQTLGIWNTNIRLRLLACRFTSM